MMVFVVLGDIFECLVIKQHSRFMVSGGILGDSRKHKYCISWTSAGGLARLLLAGSHFDQQSSYLYIVVF